MFATPMPGQEIAILSLDVPMLVSGAILILTFVGIFTEGVHHIHRTNPSLP